MAMGEDVASPAQSTAAAPEVQPAGPQAQGSELI